MRFLQRGDEIGLNFKDHPHGRDCQEKGK